MSKKPFVSIIILNFNGREFIGQCIDSVLKSNYPDFEIIVVDNGSTDGSGRYLKRRYGRNKRVRLILSDKNLFFAAGSNLGASQARGKKLVFLNSDTVVEKDWLKELVSVSLNHPQYLVQPKILSCWQKDVIDNVGGRYTLLSAGKGIGHGEKDRGQYDQNCPIDFANGTCFMIERKFFQKLAGFDPWYQHHYEDVDLNLRAKKKGGRSWYCWKSTVYHKGSLTVKRNILKEDLLFNIRKNRLRTVIKNFTGLERFGRLSILILLYFGLIAQDLLIFKKQRAFLTIKSLTTAFCEKIKKEP